MHCLIYQEAVLENIQLRKVELCPSQAYVGGYLYCIAIAICYVITCSAVILDADWSICVRHGPFTLKITRHNRYRMVASNVMYLFLTNHGRAGDKFVTSYLKVRSGLLSTTSHPWMTLVGYQAVPYFQTGLI